MSKNNGGRRGPLVDVSALQQMAAQATPIQAREEPPSRSLHDAKKAHPWDEMRPTQHFVLVEQVSTEERTLGGVIIPESAQQQHWQVLAVGPLVTDLKPGDFVMAGSQTGGIAVRVVEGRTFAMLWHGHEPCHTTIPAIMPAPDLSRARPNPNAPPGAESSGGDAS